jgi:predicted  nucleic acid-binding Zn-ribbon protein
MLTLEERERLAYITNSPDHPLIVMALEGDEEVQADLQRTEEQLKEADDRADKLEGEKEELEIQVGDLEEKVKDLEQQIHEAGVDLV